MTPRLLSTIAWLALAAPVLPQAGVPDSQGTTPRMPAASVTEHRGTYNGQSIAYTSTVAATLVPGPNGAPGGSMVTTSYVRTEVAGRAARPVLFAFNGGPGASSSPLHFSAFGPRRYVSVNGEREMGDNPFSPLDVMDLVFIDPIGTGYSRPLPGVEGGYFWSVSGDAASVRALIVEWLKRNGREGSPRFLCGESYGTSRAAQIVSLGDELAFDGVLLLSMPGEVEGPDLPFAMLLPTYAATAAFHGRGVAMGRTPAEVFDEALAFARGDYLGALARGPSLPAAERTRVAAEVSRRIGLPAAFIEERNLRVGRLDFMLNLLRDRGLRTGQIDARATGRLEDYAGRTPPYDDPSMFPPGGGRSRPTAHRYFTDELGFAPNDEYVPLNLDINGKWRFDLDRPVKDPVGLIGAAMRRQRRLRLFWAAGYYDITTPLATGRYILDRAGVPPDRLVVAAFPTGHMPYDGDANLARFAQAVREFVAR